VFSALLLKLVNLDLVSANGMPVQMLR
jgi:hypothetical protein